MAVSAPQVAPFGSWKSPITPEMMTAGTIRLGDIRVSAGSTYWLEGRPLEGGRSVVVRRDADGSEHDVTPAGYNARTRVHEYGGGSWWLDGDTVYFVNFADQRLYRQEHGGEPVAITAEPEVPSGLRYAEGLLTPADRGHLIICVRERHTPEDRSVDVVNELVALPADGSAEPKIIAGGHDFYSSAALSPDGTRLAWLCWEHPRMPWDGVELWVADVALDGSLSNQTLVAGGLEESIFQPLWSSDGVLHFVSDRTGWWNLYAWRDGKIEALAAAEAEFGVPQWVFGQSTYGFVSGGRIACVYGIDGIDHLGLIEPGKQGVSEVETPFSLIAGIFTDPSQDRVWFEGGSPTAPAALVSLDLGSGDVEIIKRSSTVEVDPGYISVAEPIEFPTDNGQTAHALYYRPLNKDFVGPEDERPPLLVLSHGGPTGHTDASFSLGIQYWTSRGIAVVDVNYGGSTGYGREYRERLKGNWGIVDVADCSNAARYLADRSEVDGKRMAIRGGSAGGYTTLSCLAFTDVFAAGSSHFGVADAGALARDTHKFESRYLDGLIGPYPEAEDLYRERSALFHTNQFSCPIILQQGLEDKVVPPAQAEAMVDALDERRLPYAYLAYEGEQHGFRKAENIQRAIEADLYFFGRIFGFEPADQIEPVEIHNLERYR